MERTVRQRLADADLKLAKGDASGRGSRVAPGTGARCDQRGCAGHVVRIQRSTPSVTRRRLVAVACAIAGAGIGGALWIAQPGGNEPPAQPAATPSVSATIAYPGPKPLVSIAPPPAAPAADTASSISAPAADPDRKVGPLAPAIPAPVVDRPIPRTEPVEPPPPIVDAVAAPERVPSEGVLPAPVPPAPSAATPAAAPPAVAPDVSTPPLAATPPHPVVVPGPLDRERPGILQALNRYQSAYRERSVKSLVSVYPSLPRETRQALDRAFSRDCRDYDVTFGNMQLAVDADDPTYATVTVRTVYTCQPKTAQAARPEAVQELFVLRKLGDGWLIDSAGTMDTARR